MNKIVVFCLFFILILPGSSATYSQFSEGKWFYWLSPGVYITLMQVREDLGDITKYIFSSSNWFNGLKFSNGTWVHFDNISLTWRIIKVHEDTALVNYTIMLYNASYARRYLYSLIPLSPIGDIVLLSINVLVKLNTLDVYSENGTYIGRWPFWIHGHEIGSKVTMVHDVLAFDPVAFFKNGTTIMTCQDSKVILRDLSTIRYKIGVSTTLGFFHTTRLVACYPVMVPLENINASIIYVNSTNSVRKPRIYVEAGSLFPALYDKVSLVMIAYCGESYIDDIIRYVIGDVQIWLKKPLVLTYGNIDFKFEEKPSLSNASQSETSEESSGVQSKESTNIKTSRFLLFVSITIIAIMVTGGILYVWKRRRG